MDYQYHASVPPGNKYILRDALHCHVKGKDDIRLPLPPKNSIFSWGNKSFKRQHMHSTDKDADTPHVRKAPEETNYIRKRVGSMVLDSLQLLWEPF